VSAFIVNDTNFCDLMIKIVAKFSLSLIGVFCFVVFYLFVVYLADFDTKLYF